MGRLTLGLVFEYGCCGPGFTCCLSRANKLHDGRTRFLLVVSVRGIILGKRRPLSISVGMFSLNFFFLPPLYTLSIAHPPENWVALTAFFTTALAVGQLSARAKHEPRRARRDGARSTLYQELQSAFGTLRVTRKP